MHYDIILSWPTNSGKSTQAWLLQNHFPTSHEVVDVGQLLRERSLVPDEVGEILSEAITKGVSAPPLLVAQIMADKIQTVKKNGKFCILTFSRLNQETADFFSEILSPSSTMLLSIEHIDADILMTRWSLRLMDSSNGMVYSKKTVWHLAKETQTRLKERIDDNPMIIKSKIQDYLNHFQQRLAIWEGMGYKVFHIDGNGDGQEVFSRILRTIL